MCENVLPLRNQCRTALKGVKSKRLAFLLLQILQFESSLVRVNVAGLETKKRKKRKRKSELPAAKQRRTFSASLVLSVSVPQIVLKKLKSQFAIPKQFGQTDPLSILSCAHIQ
jgi:hypothetical protein